MCEETDESDVQSVADQGLTHRHIDIDLSPVHTGDKVEFNTVHFVETQQSRPCCFGPPCTH